MGNPKTGQKYQKGALLIEKRLELKTLTLMHIFISIQIFLCCIILFQFCQSYMSESEQMTDGNLILLSL